MRSFLLFLPCLLFSFQDQTAQKKCIVTGRVTNMLTGEPVRKANVHLAAAGRQTNTQSQGYGGLSDAQGYFRFESVNAGQYSLRGDRPGYLTTQYGAKGPGQSGTLLTLQSGQEMTDLTLALIPQGVITGRVLDEDGDPLSGVQVQAFKQTWIQGRSRLMMQGGTSSNDLGEFRTGSLAPGKYFLMAQVVGMRTGVNEAPAIPGAPDLHQVPTFFPDAATMENAAPVLVAAGQNASGMDIRVQRVRTFHVRGKIAGPGPEGPDNLMVSLLPKDQSGMMFGGRAGTSLKDRSFDIPGVAPGAYYLNVANLRDGMASAAARQPIEVGGSDVNDVIVSIAPPGTLRGRVSVEGDGPRNPDLHIQMYLLPVEEGIMAMSQVKFAGDGTFSVENVGPGKYYPQISGAPEGAYLKSVRWGQQELLGKDLDLSGGASGELDIVFRYGVAQVSGTVQVPQDTIKSATQDLTVLLAPLVLNADGSGVEFGAADQNGAFSFKRVTPGRYLAYALEQVDMNQLQNPDVLKQLAGKGTEIEIQENDKKQIQLTPIPADDLKRIFEAQ